MKEKIRCPWANDELSCKYHDNEWGVPVHDDNKLFEALILECMQSGLSWNIILKKRPYFLLAFDNFDIDKIILYDENKIQTLMLNKNIIRNRRKIEAVINNAIMFKRIQQEYGSFDKFIWSYTNYEIIYNCYDKLEDIPITTDLSDVISNDMKKMGFKFVGSTIIYSYIQAIGIINNHLKSCYLYNGNIQSH